MSSLFLLACAIYLFPLLGSAQPSPTDLVCLPELFLLENLDEYRILCVCRGTDPPRLIGTAAFGLPIPPEGDTEGSVAATQRCFDRRSSSLQQSCTNGNTRVFVQLAENVLSDCLNEPLTAEEELLNGPYMADTSTCMFQFTQRSGEFNLAFSACICDQEEGFRVLLVEQFPLEGTVEEANQTWLALNSCVQGSAKQLNNLCRRFDTKFLDRSRDIVQKCFDRI